MDKGDSVPLSDTAVRDVIIFNTFEFKDISLMCLDSISPSIHEGNGLFLVNYFADTVCR